MKKLSQKESLNLALNTLQKNGALKENAPDEMIAVIEDELAKVVE